MKPAWLTRLSVLVAPVTGSLILLTLGWQAGLLLMQLIYPAASVTPDNRLTERWLVAGQKPQATDAQLGYARLFPAPEKAPQPVAAPVTPLKMVLSAVFVAPEPENSGAIIATLKQNARYYKVGEEVEPGIRLQSVQDDHVVLDRGGRSEALYFKDAAPGDRVTAVSPATAPAAASSAPVRSALPGQRPQPAVPKAVQQLPQTELGSDIRRLNAAAFMRKYQQKMQQDPQGLLSEAGITPASGGGYRIGDSPYAGLLTSAGLEMGDVILSVNGNRLGDPAADSGLLGSLAQQSEVEVMIQRGSRQFAVTFPITR